MEEVEEVGGVKVEGVEPSGSGDVPGVSVPGVPGAGTPGNEVEEVMFGVSNVDVGVPDVKRPVSVDEDVSPVVVVGELNWEVPLTSASSSGLVS